jgi:hypothetical protein
LLTEVPKASLSEQLEALEVWLDGKYSHVFHLVVQRFSYLRRFSPTLLKALRFQVENGEHKALVKAIDLLREMNEENKRKLPEDAPLGFIPRRLRDLVVTEEGVAKSAWECALLTVVRDEIKAGNVFLTQSKRFGRFDDFFISNMEWSALRERFFQQAGLPVKAEQVEEYLTNRLNDAYEGFS